ncbi:hypothetical protein AB0I84_04675 [Streptomyces spectabilis]|uniref:hypothetical protein n=1 Tax=Streptomyces spectabilis TaxID=68270 RepID=UPI00340AC7F9
MTTRTDGYVAAILAALLLVVGLTVLVTGVATETDDGPVITVGASVTVLATLITAATTYRAVRRHVTKEIDQRVAALVRNIVAHDAKFTAEPQDAKIVPIDGTQSRRLTRESAT